LSVYAYEDAKWTEMLDLVDRTSPYALTGAVFARDRAAIVEASSALRNAAGNFYINDKPTGAVVGQQPFGGARASGTNDKSGAKLNLIRWVNTRTIKETLAPPHDHRYPFMDAEGEKEKCHAFLSELVRKLLHNSIRQRIRHLQDVVVDGVPRADVRIPVLVEPRLHFGRG